MKLNKKDLIKFANKKFSINKNFGTQFFGIHIPKNAISGRLTYDTYFYCDDFSQFKTDKTWYQIYLFCLNTDEKFHPVLLNARTFLALLLKIYISEHNLYNIKCKNIPERCSVYDPRTGHRRVTDNVIRKHNKTIPMKKDDSWKNPEIDLNIGEYMIVAMYKFKCGGRCS